MWLLNREQLLSQDHVEETLRSPGPYADLNISGVTGITEAQRAALKALGAIEEEPQTLP